MQINHEEIKRNLSGLLNYAKEIHNIKSRVRTDYTTHPQIRYLKYGYNFINCDNISVGDENNDSWITIQRKERTSPPEPPESCQLFLKGKTLNNPQKKPQLEDTASLKASIDQASDLIESGLADENDVNEFVKNDQTNNNYVKLILKIENWPHAVSDFESWLNKTWEPWAEHERAIHEQIKMYKDYFQIHHEIKKYSDDFEIVLSQGFAFLKGQENNLIAPLVEHVLESHVDEDDNFKIKLTPKENGRRINTEPFTYCNITGANQIQPTIEKILNKFDSQENITPLPFNEKYTDFLGIQIAALHAEGQFRNDLEKPISPSKQLITSNIWAISIQPKSRQPYVANINTLQEQLETTDLSSVGIAFGSKPSDTNINEEDKIELGSSALDQDYSSQSGTEGRAYDKDSSQMEYFFPLEANTEQRSIIESVEKTEALAVQGPPGTGKSHTIANIVGHYMATGRRVLISAKTAEALAGVREKLPETLANLTISILYNDQEGKKQVENAISFISSNVQTLNNKEIARQKNELENEISGYRKEISDIETALYNHAEKQLNQVKYADKSYTPAELVEVIKNKQIEAEWLEDALTLDEKFIPGFDDDIINEIREIRRDVGDYLVYSDVKQSDIYFNFDTPEIKKIHEKIQKRDDIIKSFSNQELPEPATSADNFEDKFQKALNICLSIKDVKSHAEHHPEWGDFIKHLFSRSTLDEEREELYDLLSKAYGWLQKIEKKLVLSINIDGFDWSDKDVQSAITKYSNGENPFFLFNVFKGKAKKELRKITIRGVPPESVNDWSDIKDFIELVEKFSPLRRRWNSLASYLNFPHIPKETGGTINFLKKHRRILNAANIQYDDWLYIIDNIPILYPWGIDSVKVTDLDDEFDKLLDAMRLWDSSRQLDEALQTPQILLEVAQKYSGNIFSELKEFANLLGSDHDTEEIGNKWDKIRKDLHSLYNKLPRIQRLRDLVQLIIDSGAPIWANRLLNEPPYINQDKYTPVNWKDVWEYKRAIGFLNSLPSRHKINELSEKLSRLEVDVRRKFNNLIEIRTLIGLRQNLTPRISSALSRFKSAFSKLGKNITGKRSLGHWKEARAAMSECYDAIPCWIIPEGKVAEQIPANMEAFDLVIIDEASQSDITSIPVILRAQKLLVVGDDKQVSPSLAGIKEDKVTNLMENYLSDHPLKRSFHPGNSLYDLVSIMSPGQKIMLREHFRCVEPIISFCSNNFYSEPLIPLRQPDSKDRLDPPLIDIYVKDGYKSKDRNEREANVITEEIEKITHDESMANRTIGVISLIGYKQAEFIQTQLVNRIGAEKISHHKIECGDARYFQGQERDIMFLSMVASPGNTVSQSSTDVQQRYNVAVSRAKDRLVLVRSVSIDDLKNKDDLKLALINHFREPVNVSNESNNKTDLCESGFERQVYNRLYEEGFDVHPQVKAGHYRIDMVVYGQDDSKLAIELDGDRYHGPDKFAEDQKRQKQLERVGWKFWRCWASDWYYDKEICFQEILNRLDEMGISRVCSTEASKPFVRHETRGDDKTAEEITNELNFLASKEDNQQLLEDKESLVSS